MMEVFPKPRDCCLEGYCLLQQSPHKQRPTPGLWLQRQVWGPLHVGAPECDNNSSLFLVQQVSGSHLNSKAKLDGMRLPF